MGAIGGIHVENSRIGIGKDARDAIVGRDGCVTMLHLQAAEMYPQIRADLGLGVLIHVRMYAPNWFVLDPRKWAQDTLAFLRGIPGLLDDPRVLITAANEPDLAAEGHPGAATPEHPHPTLAVWSEIWKWSGLFSSEWRNIAKGTRVKLGTTPVAGGHEPAGFPPGYEFQLLDFRLHALDCDAIVAHGYCERDWTGHSPETNGYWAALRCVRPAGWRERDGTMPLGGISDPGGVATQLPRMPFLLAEFGNWRHNDAGGAEVEKTLAQFHSVYKFMSETRRCLGVTPFIWNCGDEHRENRIYGNNALVDGLKRMERFPAAEIVVPPAQAWYWPLAKVEVTQPFSAAHKATDMRAPTGTPVFAVCDGTVSAIQGEKYGNAFVLSLPGEYYAVGAHLQEVTKTGNVLAGEQIAIADATGLCDPPGAAHLHFEIRDAQQNRYDPMVFLAGKGAIYPSSATPPPATDWEAKYNEVKLELTAAQARISAARFAVNSAKSILEE